MLGKKKKTWSSLLAIILSLTCALGTIPVSAYEGEPPENADSLTVDETVEPEATDSAEESESTNGVVVEEEVKSGEEEESNENSAEVEQKPIEESAETVPVEEFVEDAFSDDRTNLALGATYSGTEPFENLYPDTGNRELTDGLFGSLDYGDPNYVGYAEGSTELIFDLGYKQTFDEVSFEYICDSGPGIGAPNSVTVSYSSDKLNWTEFAVGDSGNSEGIATYTYSLTGAPATARFIKVHIKFATSWLFISEVEIMGVWSERDPKEAVFTTDLPTNVNKYEGDAVNLKVDYTLEETGSQVDIIWMKDNEELSQFNGQKAIKIPNAQMSDSGIYQACIVNRFEDGSEVQSFSSAALVAIEESALEDNDPPSDVPDSDTNNLAFGKPYTLSASPEEYFTDQGQMTDGLYGSKKILWMADGLVFPVMLK